MESTTVIKALGLLEALAMTGRGKSLAELALEMRMPKPTAHRLLKTLSATGYVEKRDPGMYRPGPALARLAARGADDILQGIAAPVLKELHRVTRETVNLGVLRHADVVYLKVLESPQPLRRVVTANSTDPFYCTALGRAIAAHLPSPQIDFLLSTARLQKKTTSTVIDVAKLQRVLQEVHGSGYSIEVDQTDVGVTCLAVPIFDTRGVRAAISLSVPSSRTDKLQNGKWLKLLQQGALRITKQLKTGAVAQSEQGTDP
ncbi:MAG TPA: IclR family transcriptional regulator [Pirellulales bacterium]|jgi:IclR family acetate operon transcriptional repressor/IclR family KDG regulon transcriptional repressor